MLQISRRLLMLAAMTLLSFAALPALGQVIHEDMKLTASDGALNDQFGYSVAISGTTAIVGALNNNDRGAAYLFDTTTNQELFKLTASDAAQFDYFGSSVAISGTVAIIGAWNDDNSTGSAYLFDTITGQELFKLTASDAQQADLFGAAVAISGNTAIVGARRNDDAGDNSGSAYVFDTTTGQELFKLTASDQALGDEFGISVAISGNTAIVGAFGDDDAGANSGSAYIFDTTTGQELFKITPTNNTPGARFGWHVAISGTTAIIGARFHNNGASGVSGAAYIFDTTTGQEFIKLTASDAEFGDSFGSSVAISGTTALIGASGDDDGGSHSGSAYIFDTLTGQQHLKLTTSDAAAEDSAGEAVAISGTTAIVGVRYGETDAGPSSGSAYVFNTATPCPADLTADGILDFFDVSLFLTYFQSSNPIADFNGDGVFNFFDISIFLLAFTAGCP